MVLGTLGEGKSVDSLIESQLIKLRESMHLLDESNISNSSSITEQGKYVMDAMQANANVTGSLAQQMQEIVKILTTSSAQIQVNTEIVERVIPGIGSIVYKNGHTVSLMYYVKIKDISTIPSTGIINIGTIPVGYRPVNDMQFNAFLGGASSRQLIAKYPGFITVRGTGEISLFVPPVEADETEHIWNCFATYVSE